MRVLVTGGGSGIGLGIARALRARGDDVVLVGRRREPLAQAAAELGASIVVGDVTHDAASLLAEAGGVDGLVNNAGHFEEAALGSWTPEHFDRLIAVHLRAPALLAQAFVAQTASGAIVNISSTLARSSAPGTAAYAAAKAAVSSLTRTLAIELAPSIRVNSVLVGVVRTPMTERGDDYLAEMARIHPLGLGTPKDIGDTVAWLLHAGWVTGTEVVVDGGLLVSG